MQINRPLIWILASYLAGILLNGYSVYVGGVLLSFITMIILYQFVLLYKLRSKSSPYYFLVSLPLFFLLGYSITNEQMKISPIDGIFEEEIEVNIQGKLLVIEERDDYQRLTLKEVIIKDEYNLKTLNMVDSYKVLVNNSKITQYRLGNILKVSGTLKKFQVASNPGQFNEYQYYKNKNYDYKLNAKVITIEDTNYNKFYDNLYRLKLKFQKTYNSILDPKQSGILTAMILGDTNALDEDVNLLYKQNGISHIISISGLHVSLLGMTLYNLLRKMRIPILPATVASVFLLYSYGILTNFSVSTNRSIVMLVVYMISLLVGRTYDLLSSTALSALIILIQNPMEIYNAGFLLSFGAIVGIGTIYPVLKQFISINNSISDSFLMSIAIQLITTPILLYYFYEIPTYSVFINLIIIPLSSLVILLAVIAVILGLIYLPLGVFFVGGAHFLLLFFETVCKLALKLPSRNILTGRPNTVVIIAYFFMLIIFLMLNREKVRRLSLIVLTCTFIILIRSKTTELEVTFLDVGQGDGIVINLPGDTTFLIDGGSTNVSQLGKYRIETYLKYKGIEDIDYAIVSHADKDHVSGVLELMENNQMIKNLVLPNTNLKDEAYLSLVTLAEQKDIPIMYIKKGDVFEIGDITMTCLHPSENFNPSSRNAYSTVLSLNYKEFDLLLTGDLEADGEKAVYGLLKERLKDNKGYEILKVAHHGSKYSTNEDFLTLVNPQYAIISCGKKNNYGHPHEEVLKRIEEVTKDILITYKTGAITIKTDGVRMRVEEYLKN